MSRPMMRMVAFIAAMSTSAAVVPASMDRPAGDVGGRGSVAPDTGATGTMDVKPADPPARPANVPGGTGAMVIFGAIVVGIAAAVASGGGDDPAAFPAGTT